MSTKLNRQEELHCRIALKGKHPLGNFENSETTSRLPASAKRTPANLHTGISHPRQIESSLESPTKSRLKRDKRYFVSFVRVQPVSSDCRRKHVADVPQQRPADPLSREILRWIIPIHIVATIFSEAFLL